MKTLTEIGQQLLMDLHEPFTNEDRMRIIMEALEAAKDVGCRVAEDALLHGKFE
jgi:hypothetical protein